MSLFASLYPLAQRTTLTLLITAEGDQLRVNVMPRPNDDAKCEKTIYPLSLLATPDELDAEFADAVAIYEPSIASVLDQARAASAANTGGAAALPAPAGARRKGNRAPKAEKQEAEPAAPTDAAPAAPEVDPRQMRIDDPDDAAANAPATAEQPSQESQPELPAASEAQSEGLDVF
ncbi:PRTRC genetic system protein E [Paraburkholderia bannensis]|uniref:PRTRC genetic system protein E n=1 Tax=Paraburkholderia bannensis TaxID=765414 RepID=A0A7W9WTC1_9BURK|nr:MULTISPECIES: PRTRC system protein E [Paraburkholderia]MBB3259974.1 PRTRC genetic system protein E [Paraburkholderia sp. WP4_3_2]MBB6105180.1 PRTRC genetic system protein E [Paraburkholderia bannensis]